MIIKKIKGPFILVLVALFIFSCNKEDDIIPPDLENEAPEPENEYTPPVPENEKPNENAICLITKQHGKGGGTDGEEAWEYDLIFEYDEEDRPIRRELREKTISYYLFSYNEEGNLSEVNYHSDSGELMSLYTYQYDEMGRMIRENFFRKNPGDTELQFSRIQKIEYDNLNRIIKASFFDPSTGNLTRYSTYESFDEAGNYRIEHSFDRDSKLRRITESEYDDKPNAHQSTNGFFWEFDVYFTTPNNKVRETDKDSDGNIDRLVNYDFEYNDEGYPSRMLLDGDIANFEYNCK